MYGIRIRILLYYTWIRIQCYYILDYTTYTILYYTILLYMYTIRALYIYTILLLYYYTLYTLHIYHTLGNDIPLYKKSILYSMLPESLICILINYGYERFASVFIGKRCV